MRTGKKWAGLIIFTLLIMLLMTAAMADTASSYAKADKTEVKVGDTITVTYDFTALNAERTVKATKTAYRWAGTYPKEGQDYPQTITLEENVVSGVKGKLTYKVQDYDGDTINLYLYARTDDDTSSIYFENIKIKVTNAKKLTPVKMSLKLDQGTTIPNEESFKLNYEITGGTGDYSTLYYWIELRTDNEESDSYVYVASGTLDKTEGSLEGKLNANQTMDTSEVYTKLVIKFSVGDRWEYAYFVPDGIPLSYIQLGKSGWVSKDGYTYYGDRNGHGYRGMITVDEKLYYLDENGRLQTGFFKAKDRNSDDLVWYYADDSGEIHDNCEGMSSLTVPAEVDTWPKTYYRDFLSQVDRDFVIYCIPGSFAEKFAKKHGLQYDNGKERVVGYTIDDVDKKVDWIVEHYLTNSMSDREKALVLHNWLIYNAHYDTSYSVYTADGVLVKGYGVCDSYSKAYKLLLDKIGIANIRISGGNHAWNMLKIDGTWYHVDTTWDDPTGPTGEHTISGFESDTYFLKDDAFMAINHTWNPTVVAESMKYAEGRGWVLIGGHWYYYGVNNIPVKGIAEIDGVTYGFEETGILASGWFTYEGHWYATDAKGILIQNSWKQEGEKWYYIGKDGQMVTGLQMIEETGYFFDASGVMVTGWQTQDGHWYYFLSSGAMARGWYQVDDDWYYLDQDGIMAVGLTKIGTVTYYFNKSGMMGTGWAQIDGSWFYFLEDGSMVLGWSRVDDSWYYFISSGEMATGWKQIGGAWYYFQNDGAMVTGWKQIGSAWFYFLKDGAMATEWQVINGSWEYFNEDGTWSYTWGPVEE